MSEYTFGVSVKRLKDSRLISAIAIFAALNVICDSFIGPPLPSSGVWYSWIFVSEPITGIILGAWSGFFSTLIGVMVGHFVYFRGAEEFLFTLGAPIGAMISALIFRGKWKMALVYYLALLGGFFVTPISWQLPFWGMWNVYLALGFVFVVIVVVKKCKNLWSAESKAFRLHALALSAFIGLEADVLFRVFVFIPCQTYKLFFPFSLGDLQAIWAIAAIETSTKAALSTIINVIVGLPLIAAVQKMSFTPSKDQQD